MRFSLVAALLGTLTALPALSQTCPPFVAQSPSTFPAEIAGRMVYERTYADPNRSVNDNEASDIYLYDLASRQLTDIPTASWGLRLPLNPVFSKDGKGVLFSAIRTASGGQELRDLFYWTIGSAGPATNLTESGDGDVRRQRNEDPKFSQKGEKIVWKQQGGIAVADFATLGGVPTLSNVQHLLNGTLGDSTEKSGPVFSPTEKYIYYFGASGTAERIWRYNFITKDKSTVVKMPTKSGLTAYYPVDPDIYDLIYVSKLDASHPQDKIYVLSLMTSRSYIWNGTDCDADNSDPAPIDEDYFLYSRSPGTSSTDYRLFVGQLNGGQAWDLSSLGLALFDGSDGDLKGADYTAVRP
ncbi:MAG TPA: hypothetical protein VGF56_00065 [Rhizomicrobium sp.]|jgi:Tol biopolymer transport system component